MKDITSVVHRGQACGWLIHAAHCVVQRKLASASPSQALPAVQCEGPGFTTSVPGSAHCVVWRDLASAPLSQALQDMHTCAVAGALLTATRHRQCPCPC